jgi:hypothetical protein
LFEWIEINTMGRSCAAKHKSVHALPGDRTLFAQLSAAIVLQANLSTQLVMDVENHPDSPMKAECNRPSIHYQAVENVLKLYVPKDRQQRRACYRSQLPKLLADIIGVDSSAHYDISVIMSSDLRSLDDVLIELDISSVSWIAKPERDISDDDDSATSIQGTLQDSSSRSASNSPSSTENTLVEHRSNLRTPGSSASRSRFHLGIRDMDDVEDVEDDDEAFVPTPPPPQYHEFVEQVLRNARRSGYANTSNSNRIPISGSSPLNGPSPTAFDRTATFGDRTADQMKHDRRIGAAGEAFVSLTKWSSELLLIS